MRIDVKFARIDCGAIRFPTKNKTGEKQVVAAYEDDSLRGNVHVDYAEYRRPLDQTEGHHTRLRKHGKMKQCVLATHTCNKLSYGRANSWTENEDGVMTDGRTATASEGGG